MEVKVAFDRSEYSFHMDADVFRVTNPATKDSVEVRVPRMPDRREESLKLAGEKGLQLLLEISAVRKIRSAGEEIEITTGEWRALERSEWRALERSEWFLLSKGSAEISESFMRHGYATINGKTVKIVTELNYEPSILPT